MGATTNLTTRPAATIGDSIDLVTGAELDNQASGGVLTVAASKTFVMHGNGIPIASRIALEGAQTFFLSGLERAPSSILASNTGDFISGDGDFRINFNAVVSTSTGTLFNTNTTRTHNLQNAALVGWDDLGTVENGNLVFRFSNILNCDSGLTFTNCGVTILNLQLTLPALVGPLFTVAPDTDPNTYRFADISGEGFTGTLLRIDPAINVDSRVIVKENSLPGTLFDTTGSTGTFTVVADAAIGVTGINSVTDSSGVARFNYTVGPTTFVDQTVTISGFVTNTAYNVTGKITATGIGFLEIASVDFGTDEGVGSFVSDSITLTDTATTLVDGDTLVIDTDLSTDYDRGVTVYNQLTNTFQIDGTFTATATGSWDTSGLDQKDPRVIATDNPGFAASAYIASAFVNNNTTANGAIVNNTFTDMVFGTAGSALIAGSNIERWKLIDDVNGTFEYTGNEPFDGILTFDATATSSGGAQEFRFKWLHDVGAGFVDLPDAVEALVEIGNTAGTTTKHIPLQAVIGDQIKPQITRNAGTSGVTTSYFSVNAIQ